MILAAGHGSRLRPLTTRIPKCMVPVRGRPVLEHTIEWLVSCGVSEIIINVSHLADTIISHFGDGRRWGAKITYSREERPLGTAGGVQRASWFFDRPFLVWYGDNFSRCDIDRLYRFHREKEGLATLSLHYREDVSQSGIVAVDSNDRVVDFLEKPSPDRVFSRWVNAGIYVLEPEVLGFIRQADSSDFGHDVFPEMLAKQQPLYGYRLSTAEGLTWIDRPEDVQRLSQEVESRT